MAKACYGAAVFNVMHCLVFCVWKWGFWVLYIIKGCGICYDMKVMYMTRGDAEARVEYWSKSNKDLAVSHQLFSVHDGRGLGLAKGSSEEVK